MQFDRSCPVAVARTLGHALALALVAGCGAPAVTSGINDPHEARNREVHAFNKNIDRAFVRGGSGAYGEAVPRPVRGGITNFVGNADMPRLVLNDVLQGEAEDALHNTFRFLVNTTFGIGGLLDPASDMGLEARQTDFGETLHVWGAGEGAYLELPVLGPSTERDAFGRAVDFAVNPLNFALPRKERVAVLGLGVVDAFGGRASFGSTVDSVLYDSADSYAQARLLYLQNRRFQLGGPAAGPTGTEVAGPGGDPYLDPYADP